jgi:hypothetical protein
MQVNFTAKPAQPDKKTRQGGIWRGVFGLRDRFHNLRHTFIFCEVHEQENLREEARPSTILKARNSTVGGLRSSQHREVDPHL